MKEWSEDLNEKKGKKRDRARDVKSQEKIKRLLGRGGGGGFVKM
jgi:hypothetical protein